MVDTRWLLLHRHRLTLLGLMGHGLWGESGSACCSNGAGPCHQSPGPPGALPCAPKPPNYGQPHLFWGSVPAPSALGAQVRLKPAPETCARLPPGHMQPGSGDGKAAATPTPMPPPQALRPHTVCEDPLAQAHCPLPLEGGGEVSPTLCRCQAQSLTLVGVGVRPPAHTREKVARVPVLSSCSDTEILPRS